MSANVRPAGPAHWLFPKLNVKGWHVIACASFETRCTALAEWLLAGNGAVVSSSVVKIENPPSDAWSDASPIVDASCEALQRMLQAAPLRVIPLQLLDPVSRLSAQDGIGVESATSVVLDISTMPKRYFLFALRRLMASTTVKDLVVTYTRAQSYPEVPLCENALPPAALQGFGRIEPQRDRGRLVVGVGFVPLSVSELLERAKRAKLDFIFPFPPASPAYRRNWNLLSMLLPEGDIPRNTEIHRVNALDAFEVFERVISWSQGGALDIDMIPLGPKPHALGMAMAYLRLEGHGELTYSQPQSYGANYSTGVAVDLLGRPSITAYCLKYGGKPTF